MSKIDKIHEAQGIVISIKQNLKKGIENTLNEGEKLADLKVKAEGLKSKYINIQNKANYWKTTQRNFKKKQRGRGIILY